MHGVALWGERRKQGGVGQQALVLGRPGGCHGLFAAAIGRGHLRVLARDAAHVAASFLLVKRNLLLFASFVSVITGYLFALNGAKLLALKFGFAQ